jgi:hypothetical protein
MDKRSVTILYQRYEWISNHLEREAYKKQMNGRSKPLSHFIPCAKALIFTHAMGNPDGVVTGIVIPEASHAICPCHPGLSEAALWSLYTQAAKVFPQDNMD